MDGFWTSRAVIAVTLIVVGVVLLAAQYLGGVAANVWPLFIIVPGVALVAFGLGESTTSKTLAATGGVVTGVGGILLVQNLTDYFQSWAYAWTLLPAFAGAGMYVAAERQRDSERKNMAWRLIQASIVAFFVFALAFELLIFHDRLFAGNLILPLILIVAGGLLLFRPRGDRSGGGGAAPAA